MAITTAEELLRAGDIGRCELVRGELRRMIPAGDEHGRITVGVTCAVGNHVRAHKLGVLHGAETGFILSRDPDTVRAPDRIGPFDPQAKEVTGDPVRVTRGTFRDRTPHPSPDGEWVAFTHDDDTS